MVTVLRSASSRLAYWAGVSPRSPFFGRCCNWSGLVKPAELAHDTAVYRAALHEQARIEADSVLVVLASPVTLVPLRDRFIVDIHVGA